MSARHQIVELILAGDSRAAAAADALSKTGSWEEAIELAQVWKVIPQFAARIHGLRLKLTPVETGALRRAVLRAHGQSASRAAKAIEAIRELELAGIRVVAFKGVASMAVLYGGPRHRTIGDGDLLILRKDISKALACLAAKGFVREGEETLAQYLSFVENAPRFAGNEAIALHAEDGSEIDLHWNLAGSGMRIEEILDRSVVAELMGHKIPVVSSVDGFLLTVHHAIREDLGIESVCRDLLDVGLWCNNLEKIDRLGEGMKWSAQSGSQVAALAVTSLLEGYDGTSAVVRAADLLRSFASRPERRSAALLTELFHYQIGRGRLGKDVFYLVHSRPLRQIVKGLTTDWKGYRRSIRTLETQLREEQTLFRRFTRLAGSVPGPKGLRLARALARVKYR